MIRQDEEREEDLSALRRLIEEGEESGVSPRTADEIQAAARRRASVGE